MRNSSFKKRFKINFLEKRVFIFLDILLAFLAIMFLSPLVLADEGSNITTDPSDGDTIAQDYIDYSANASATSGNNSLITILDSTYPLGWWSLDNSVDGVEDYFGNNNLGIHGDPTYSAGVVNNATYLDGTGDYFSINQGTGKFTYSTWIKTSDTFFSLLAWGDNANRAFFYQDGEFKMYKAGANNRRFWSVPNFNDSEWHHLVVTSTGWNVSDIENSQLYIDGQEISSGFTAATSISGIPTSFSFGADNDGSGELQGYLDDSIMFDSVLNENEILALYANSSEVNFTNTYSNLDFTNHTLQSYSQSSDGSIETTGSMNIALIDRHPTITYVSPTPDDNLITERNYIDFNATVETSETEYLTTNYYYNGSDYDRSWWRMENFYTDGFEDTIGTNNLISYGDPSYVLGKYGDAIYLDGTGDYFETEMISDSITYSGWFKSNDSIITYLSWGNTLNSSLYFENDNINFGAGNPHSLVCG